MSPLVWIRRLMWVVPIALGVVFIAAGVYMISEGRSAKDEVRQALVAEKVATAEDAAIPNAPVNDAATAEAQADIIREHSLKTTGGKTYAELSREDPNRDVYLKGVTLRTALNLAVMGFKVSDLVVGMGAFMIVVGASNVVLLAPLLYWAREAATEAERPRERKSIPVPAPTT